MTETSAEAQQHIAKEQGAAQLAALQNQLALAQEQSRISRERLEETRAASDFLARQNEKLAVLLRETAPSVPDTITARVTLSLGLAVRGQVIRDLKARAFESGIACDVQEDRGILESSYRVTLRGTQAQINDLYSWLRSL